MKLEEPNQAVPDAAIVIPFFVSHISVAPVPSSNVRDGPIRIGLICRADGVVVPPGFQRIGSPVRWLVCRYERHAA